MTRLWTTYEQPTTLVDALDLIESLGGRGRVVAGGTDLLVELRRGVRQAETVVDISRVGELRFIRDIEGVMCLGALTTHNDVLRSSACRASAWPLVQACREVGAPQIRARGTIVGNLVTASPANDTIAPLLALGAEVVIVRRDRERVVPLDAFYPGFRKTVLGPGELVREVRFPALGAASRGIFLKLGLRRAQAISVINLAIVLTLRGERVGTARVALGSVAPTAIRAGRTEAFLTGAALDADVFRRAGEIAADEITPIGDVRGSAEYRRLTVAELVADALRRLAHADGRENGATDPVLLETPAPRLVARRFAGTIETTINGQPRLLAVSHGRTLLSALRDDAGLTGTKEGCAEGECGACTVWLDGQAVMSCLVPAAQAHGVAVTTIEGLGDPARPHRLQRSFVDHGAVQCGYCIPGFVMAGAKLLDERARPDLAAVQTALSGNICRCTGYRKIFDAVLAAGETADASAAEAP